MEKTAEPVAAQADLPARTNCLFMGTNVRSGSGSMLVVHTGKATVYSHIAHSLRLRPPETEFERGIRRFGYLLSDMLLLILVLIVFAVNVALHKPVLDALLFSVALAVGLTPQLLPAIISIHAGPGMRATWPRRASSCGGWRPSENFGSMDILCTDKTGTLTEGVVQLDGTARQPGAWRRRLSSTPPISTRFQTGLQRIGRRHLG
ncbi:MAG: hypothetical protein R2854_15115 [Caldilineaceae bacterium]